MTPQQLLIPRYEVIADYPNSPFELNTVYNQNEIDFGIGMLLPQNFPAIFRPLHWSERREIGEMPEYLKYEEGGVLQFVVKVEQYITHSKSSRLWAFEYKWQDEPDIKKMALSGWEPCTETDYLNYINANK